MTASLNNSSSPKSVTASCSTGSKRVLGGGYVLSGLTVGEIGISASAPLVNTPPSPSGWTVIAAEVNPNNNNWTITAYAICVD